MKIAKYHFATSVEDAYQKLQEVKKSLIIGGGAWLRLSERDLDVAIDLSNLQLNQIIEKDDSFEIGCMTTLREMETNERLNEYFDGVIRNSFGTVMGVQVRNIATIGGTIAGKLGFSDIITPLLALDVYLKFYKKGMVSLQEFIEGKGFKKDILLSIIIKKNDARVSFHAMKKTSNDFAVINVAVSLIEKKHKIVIGSRPGIAKLATKAMTYMDNAKQLTDDTFLQAGLLAVEELTLGNNTKGSKEYREQVGKVFVKRALKEVHDYEN